MLISRNPIRTLRRAARVFQGRDLWQKVQIHSESLRLGNKGADWTIIPLNLSEQSVVYSLGVGEDISFDLELIKRFAVTVHAFDPTPRSIAWLANQTLPARFRFQGLGIADYDGTARFSPPLVREHVSHTMLEIKTSLPAVEAPVQRLSTIMKSLGHDRIDLLKMDIEGAEYAVLEDLLASHLCVHQLLVEFHHRWPQIGARKTKEIIRELNLNGYQIFSVSPSGEEFSFCRVSAS
jgi:FkbM family methyltransferase